MKDEQNKIIYSHKNMYLEYVSTPNGLHQIAFNPEREQHGVNDGVSFPNFQLAVAGKWTLPEFCTSLFSCYPLFFNR